MDKYEKSIGLKTIWLTIVRRFKIVFLFFIPILAVAFIYTQKMMKPTYSSTVTITKNSTITNDNYNKLVAYAISNEVKTNVVSALEAEGKKHKNGNAIVESDINPSFATYVSNKVSTSFTISSSDGSVTEDIANAVKNYIAENFSEKTSYSFGNASKADPGNKSTKYFIIITFVGVIIGLGLGFVDEITSDEVYDAKDVETLGLASFEINTKLAGN